MLIQESYKDVPTKADGKEGSMSKSDETFWSSKADNGKEFSSSIHQFPIIPMRVWAPQSDARRIWLLKLLQTLSGCLSVQRDLSR
jgi:hypothetical protein